MKTKFILLITSTVLSFSTHAKEITCNEECVRNHLQSEVKSEFLNWDFSTINGSEAIADVSFQVNEQGNIEVKEIAGSDFGFNSLVNTNLSKVKVDTDLFQTKKDFYIRLSYKKR
jgi:hypothetical protein